MDTAENPSAYKEPFRIPASVTGFLWERAIVTPALRAAYGSDIKAIHRRLLEKFYGFSPDTGYEFKVVMADVEKITRTERFPFAVSGPDAVFGMLHGQWDKRTRVFTETPLFQSLKMRFVDGMPWEQTPKYLSAVAELESKGKTWSSCETIEEVIDRCARLDRLYEDIKRNGYRPSRHELKSLPVQSTKKSCSVRGLALPDEVRIAVARDGHLIRCENGRHRLAIAKLLEVPRIPAIVQIEHRRWGGKLDTEYSIAI